MKRFPFVWRKTAEADEQAWKDEKAALLRRVARAEAIAKTEVTNRRRINGLNTALHDELERVTGRNAVLCVQVETAKAAGFDEAKAREAAERIAKLMDEVTQARKETGEQSRRADGLQSQLDDALGLNEPAVVAGDSWQTRCEQHMKYDKPAAEEATAS